MLQELYDFLSSTGKDQIQKKVAAIGSDGTGMFHSAESPIKLEQLKQQSMSSEEMGQLNGQPKYVVARVQLQEQTDSSNSLLLNWIQRRHPRVLATPCCGSKSDLD